MKRYSEIVASYLGATGKLTRFKGEFHKFKVAFKIDDDTIVREMQEQGAELYTLKEVGEDYALFTSRNATIYIPLQTLVIED